MLHFCFLVLFWCTPHHCLSKLASSCSHIQDLSWLQTISPLGSQSLSPWLLGQMVDRCPQGRGSPWPSGVLMVPYCIPVAWEWAAQGPIRCPDTRIVPDPENTQFSTRLPCELLGNTPFFPGLHLLATTLVTALHCKLYWSSWQYVAASTLCRFLIRKVLGWPLGAQPACRLWYGCIFCHQNGSLTHFKLLTLF